MYDEPWSDDRYSYSDPYGDRGHVPGDHLDRLTYLVLVDGRLVDFWTESVRGTRFEAAARRFDKEREPVAIEPPAPRPPAHEQILGWLRGLVGGAEALDWLGMAPLHALDPVDVEVLPLGHRHRLEGTAMALEAVHGLDPEFDIALRNAMRLLWEAEPAVLLNAASAAQAAAGLVWAVGKANGRLSPEGPLRQKDLAAALGVPAALSGPGRRVVSAFVGAPGLLEPRPHGLGCPDLVGLGGTELLTSDTRRRLLRLRDHAIRARDAQAA
jgi:hypothetical protein